MNTKNELQKLVSIIIRTKNEERWIKSCLKAVFEQKYQNFEIILVDNCSIDKTVELANEFPIKVVNIVEFTPGAAINLGIENSSGEIIVCLSGHCIPTTETWLENLIFDLADPNIVGVYGKQEPLSFTSDIDKRDLLTVFGEDRIVQTKGSFFHNANSAFKRSAWEICRFDPVLTNIEDRAWGKQMISRGYQLVYEPSASVYHWHGLHHGLNPERARNIVRILEDIVPISSSIKQKSLEETLCVAIIPIRGKSLKIDGRYLIEKAITDAKNSKYIDKVYVAADTYETQELALKFGAETTPLRTSALSQPYISTSDVIKVTIQDIEKSGVLPEIICVLDETYPNRPPHLLDNLFEILVEEGLDTILPCKLESRSIWIKRDTDYEIQKQSFMPSALKEDPVLVSCLGLGCIGWSYCLREGEFVGSKHKNYIGLNDLECLKVTESVLDSKAMFSMVERND